MHSLGATCVGSGAQSGMFCLPDPVWCENGAPSAESVWGESGERGAGILGVVYWNACEVSVLGRCPGCRSRPPLAHTLSLNLLLCNLPLCFSSAFVAQEPPLPCNLLLTFKLNGAEEDWRRSQRLEDLGLGVGWAPPADRLLEQLNVRPLKDLKADVLKGHRR